MRGVVVVSCLLAAGCLSFEPVGEDSGGSDGDGSSGGDEAAGDLEGDPPSDEGGGTDPGDGVGGDPGDEDGSTTGDGDEIPGEPPSDGDSAGVSCGEAADGTVCAIGLCREGACVSGGCFINGQWFEDGQLSPASPCRQCDANNDPLTWTNVIGTCNDDNACTHDDKCQEGVCAGTVYSCSANTRACEQVTCDGMGGCNTTTALDACLIEEQCYWDGDRHPTQVCAACDPAQSQTEWSLYPDETPCADGGQCHGGTCCVGGCWDGSTCRSGEAHNACGSGGGRCEDCTATHECGACAVSCPGSVSCAFSTLCDSAARVCVRDTGADHACCMTFCSAFDCY